MKKGAVPSDYHGIQKLNVFIKFDIDEILVGQLRLDQGTVYFKYEDSFLELGLNLSPFRLQFNNSIQAAEPEPFRGLFGLFDDSLPDGWGMLLLNRALEKKGLSLHDINVLDQLAYVGGTGKGALIYRPALTAFDNHKVKIDLDELKSSIDQVYSGSSNEVIESLMTLGGSSGGARPKAHVGYNSQKDELIYGRKKLPKGFEHYIIKFPSSEDPLDIANIEFAYHKMAVEAGIEMSECRLLESANGMQVFATKRFDRRGNKRIHMHSMAGLTHDNFRRSSIDYGNIIDVAFRLEQTAKSREKILRLAAFNIYTYNRDDHSKNFSWLMNEKGDWVFAPAYDLTYSSGAIDEHITRVAGEGAHPGRKQLLELAKEFSIAKPELIIDEVQSSISNWVDVAKASGVSKVSMRRISTRLKELKDR